jgi:hypothetical protein
MAHLTLVIEDELLQQVRARARDQGTTIDALVNYYLKEYVRRAEVEATREFIQLAASLGARSEGPWRRDELYDR